MIHRLELALVLLSALRRAAAAPTRTAYPALGAVPPLGERTKMRWEPPHRSAAREGVEAFQLFLPRAWRADGAPWPVLIFLHGAGDGVWDVMNSQSLPRLLSADQSTAFDARPTWAFDFGGARYENATFAADCGFVVVMPQGWDDRMRPGWSPRRLDRVKALADAVADAYNGDAARVSLTGQSAGGVGAWQFALRFPDFLAALVPVCGALVDREADARAVLARLPIWIFHGANDVAMPVAYADDAARTLRGPPRTTADLKFTRYARAPAPPDPRYADMAGHAAYDLAYRDAGLYAWLADQRRRSGS